MFKVEFSDCGQAAERFQQVGLDVQAVQLVGGELRGTLEAASLGTVLFLRSNMSHRTLFAGEKMYGYRPFCWMSGGGSSYYQAGTSEGGELCGFMDGRTEAHCHWDGTLNFVYLSEKYFKGYFLASRAYKALDRIEHCDKLPLSPHGLQSLKRLHRHGLEGRLQDEDQVYSLVTSLLEEPDEVITGLSECKNQSLLKRLVELAHETAEGEPLKLPDICKMLYASRSTLSAACLESYGVSVGSLMRLARLEQCRIALGQGMSVGQVMKKYRFTNRARFAAYYKAAFGVLPSGQIELFGPDCPNVVVG